MTRRIAGFIVLGALALAVGVVALWLWTRDQGPGAPVQEADEVPSGRPASFDLYFPGDGWSLGVEERELAVTDDPEDRARALVLALLDGPRESSLHRPFPEGTVLLDLYIDGDTAYVDLGIEGSEEPPASGSLAEMTRVYSVVDSLAYNLQDVERVALLWNGVQRETFAGHLDTSAPLLPRDGALAAAHRERRPEG